jgi:hypothetical protein
MWHEGFLYRVDARLIALVLCVAMVLAAWGGYRAALRRKENAETRIEALSELGPVEGAVAGLLALVVAFSFTMAAERFDARQTVIVRQSNAIGTAFLRCSVLDPDDREYCENRLRDYVDVMVAYGAAPRGEAGLERIVGQAKAIEQDVWTRVAAVAHERPTPVNAEVLTALNAVIDQRSDRVASIRIVVPQEVTMVLLLLCVLWAAIAGYAYGLKRNRKRAAWVVFSVLVALVVYVTLDFDRPRRGLVRLDAGNQSMLELQQDLRADAGPPTAQPQPPSR